MPREEARRSPGESDEGAASRPQGQNAPCADDFAAEEESFEIITSEENFEAVRDALAAQGIEFADASVQMIPQNYVSLNEEQLINMQKLIDMLEDNDDVQEIWHNCDNI